MNARQNRALTHLADWLEDAGFESVAHTALAYRDSAGERGRWQAPDLFFSALVEGVRARRPEWSDFAAAEARIQKTAHRWTAARSLRRAPVGVVAPERLVVVREPTGRDFPPVVVAFYYQAALAAFRLIGDRAYEVTLALYLNCRRALIGYEEFTSGSIDKVYVFPKGITRTAMLLGANSVVTVHQHPSGDPEPSSGDRALWERIRRMLATMDITNLDNQVVADKGFYSEHDGRCTPWSDVGVNPNGYRRSRWPK